MKYFAVLGVQPIREKLQHGTGKYTVASFVQYKQTRTQEACTRVAETWVGWNTFISVSKRDVYARTHMSAQETKLLQLPMSAAVSD